MELSKDIFQKKLDKVFPEGLPNEIDTMYYTFKRWEKPVQYYFEQFLDELKNDFQINGISFLQIMQIRSCDYWNAFNFINSVCAFPFLADYYNPNSDIFYLKLIKNYPIDKKRLKEKVINELPQNSFTYKRVVDKKCFLYIEPYFYPYLQAWINGNEIEFEFDGLSIKTVMCENNTSYYGALSKLSYIFATPYERDMFNPKSPNYFKKRLIIE